MAVTILLVDDEENFRINLGELLTSKGFEVIGASTLAEARAHLRRGMGDIVLLDVQLGDGYGPDLLAESFSLPTRPPIILITAYGEIEMAVEAMRNGAFDFLEKPIDYEHLDRSLKRACELLSMRQELFHLRESQQQDSFVVGKSQAMASTIAMAEKAAAASVSVLITGETGTGKDVLARYIHRIGPRADKPYIAENCAAIQPTMLESELFGYEAGAFTGADKRKHGLMEVADGGVLFLDEISSMPTDMQAKLLRAIEEKAFRRVGGTALIRVDVQIVAASNRNLKAMMAEGQFREDLYYRLKVVDLHLPPLRERKEDIPELVGYFMRMYNSKLGVNVRDISPRAMDALLAYPWPGNVRELSHAIERAMLFCDGELIDLADLPGEVAVPESS